MARRISKKFRPQWLLSALLVVFAAAFYQQRLKERFEDKNLTISGVKVRVNMAKLPSVLVDTLFKVNAQLGPKPYNIKIIDASDGKTVWSFSDNSVLPTFSDSVKSYIWIRDTTYVSASGTATQIGAQEAVWKINMPFEGIGALPTDWKTTSSFKMENIVIIDSNGNYVDKNGSSLIGSTNVAGYNVNTIVLWVVVGIIGLIILFVLFRVFSGGSQPTTTNNSRISQNSY